MASNGYSNPDLSAVLQTLSQFATPVVRTPVATAGAASNPAHNSQQHHHVGHDGDGEYHQSSADTIPQRPDDPYGAHHHTAQPPPPPPPPPVVETTDPSSIRTWPAALQHVMRAVAHNESLQGKIRRLIRSQHDHERQWWQGREALIVKQRARVEKKRQLEEVLRSVGAAPIDQSASTEEEDNATELRYYDAKVYHASVDMSRAMEAELRSLKIPFFAGGGDANPGSSGKSAVAGGGGGASTTTAQEMKMEMQRPPADELLVLRRRMLELLQDLCRD